jgi:hypothetical protein
MAKVSSFVFIKNRSLVRVDHGCHWVISDLISGIDDLFAPFDVFPEICFFKGEFFPDGLSDARTYIVKITKDIFLHRVQIIELLPAGDKIDPEVFACGDPAV